MQTFVTTLTIMLRTVSLLVATSMALAETYPTCGDCWCVPAANGTAPCPKFWSPETTFSSASIATYKSQVATEIYTLSCNPYENESCTTTPAQTFLDSDTAVCGYVYTKLSDGSQSCSEYSMVTYESRADLIKAGAIITHEGSCGLCSTTQDLAVYLSKDNRYIFRANFQF